MAETVHLSLKANGQDIKGESTQTSLGRENTIEVLFFNWAIKTAREASSGRASGRRQYEPLLIRKRIDKSSPLLFKAITKNEMVEGTLKFYRPNPTGDGTTEQFYTIKFEKGQINSIKGYVPPTIEPATSNEPPQEEVTFVFHTITTTFVDGGIEHTDTWDSQT